MSRLGQAIFEQSFDFIDEVITTEVEICLKLNDNYDVSKIQLLENIESEFSQTTEHLKMPVYFSDHPDWLEIERISGLRKNDFVDKLIQNTFSIAMLGFLPGFLYLNGLPAELHIPRKGKPSKHIESNSLAIGDKYLGTYSLGSPGGWHVLGKMACSLLQIAKLPPILIKPNSTIELLAVSKKEYEKILESSLNILQYNGQS